MREIIFDLLSVGKPCKTYFAPEVKTMSVSEDTCDLFHMFCLVNKTMSVSEDTCDLFQMFCLVNACVSMLFSSV
jgi:hypothetical protein